LKILHICSQSAYEGTTIYPIRIALNLISNIHFFVFCQESIAQKEFDKVGIKSVTLVKKNQRRNKIKVLCYFIKNFYSKDFDIIHYHSGGVLILFTAYLIFKGKKIIHHIHCGNISCNEKLNKLKFYEKVLYKILKDNTIQIVVAEHIKNFYEKYVGFSRNVYVIKNGVQNNFKLNTRFLYKLGYIGQIKKYKSFNKILELLDFKERFDFELKILIQGFIDKRYKQYMNLNRDYFLVRKESLNVNTFYSQIDILLFPSLMFEGTPLVILESIANNVPVIAVRNKFSKEIFGDYPFLVEEFNLSNIIKLITSFYLNERLKSELSKIHIEILKNYKLDEKMKEIEKIYKK